MSTYLSDEDFLSIYSKVPRAALDVVIRSDEGILLTLRNIEPSKGLWHLPGGTLYRGEEVVEAAKRIAKKETNLDVVITKCLGYMEFLNEVRSGISMHSVSIVVEAVYTGGELKHDGDAADLKWHTEQPEAVIPEHSELLNTTGLLLKK